MGGLFSMDAAAQLARDILGASDRLDLYILECAGILIRPVPLLQYQSVATVFAILVPSTIVLRARSHLPHLHCLRRLPQMSKHDDCTLRTFGVWNSVPSLPLPAPHQELHWICVPAQCTSLEHYVEASGDANLPE